MPATPPHELAVGKVGFVRQHGLHTEEQVEAGERAAAQVQSQGIRTVRVSWADQHGATRTKFASAQDFAVALRNGLDMTSALLSMDSSNHVFTHLFAPGIGLGIPELTGSPDVVLVPDPTTFTVLPWAAATAWVLCDMYYADGRPVPLSTRSVLAGQLAAARAMGYEFLAGLEVEFYLTRRETGRIGPDETGWPAAAPRVSILAQGYQALSETRLDELSPILTVLRDHLEQMGLPLRTMEDEWGPGQCEFTFDPQAGMASADTMVLFRSAVKQVCHAEGYHATFMCRPHLPNITSSGWHLHQSLLQLGTGANAFASPERALSPTGEQFAAGILEHALPMTVFTTPTINGYKRFKPYSFAPDRVNWAVESRGAMLRVQGQGGDQTSHLENRLGEPAANPYLYLAANIAAGLDGIRRQLQPPPLVETDPYVEDAPRLPSALWEAVDALDRDPFFREALGREIVDYVVMLKRFEVDRFLSEVTDWEQREYFEFF
ncbi:MAG TPA: glutamine synthetase family protein [Candidatus Micrarchaeia archaeon]|nr:glutamine synthetase family protein [Candidatus Micrarchaeia archaeon]